MNVAFIENMKLAQESSTNEKDDKQRADGELDSPLVASATNMCENHIIDYNSHPYTFIFGWSTGHVGTTTLSSSITYNDPKNINFIFETNRHEKFLRNLKKSWRLSSHKNEFNFVDQVFIPLMFQELGNATTLVDLGHHNLYFIYGLLNYLKHNEKFRTKYRILFVRIRRERYETALSLIYHIERQKIENICSKMLYRFCPQDRKNDIILKPFNLQLWKTNLTEFQKALWMIDEIEARWQYFLNTYEFIDYRELYWSKLIPKSLENAVCNISTILHLSAISGSHTTKTKKIPHLKIHSDSDPQSIIKDKEMFVKEDHLYKEIMKTL